MQENRSFDSYFGTYPGADGLPRRDGHFTVCSPDPRPGSASTRSTTRRPQQRRAARAPRRGARHQRRQDERVRAPGQARARAGCSVSPDAPLCSFGAAHPDVMGYHDRREIPNYWAYARNFVLQDHMFEPDTSWSLPAHLFMVSEWSAPLPHARGVELRQRGREPACAAVRAAEPDRPQAGLRVDRSHLPAAQAPRLVALLHRQGRPARLRRRRDGLHAAEAERRHARDLESAAVVRHGQGRPRARQHRPDAAAVRDGQARHVCRRSRG